MRLDLFAKLKCRTNSIKGSLGTKYSLRGLIYDAMYCEWPTNQRNGSVGVHDVSAPVSICLASYEWIPF